MKDRRNSILNDHKLVGRLEGTKAFNITGDIRVIYVEAWDTSYAYVEVGKNHFIFLDIGTHPQIYGM